MMNTTGPTITLKDAMNQESRTENGARNYSSTNNACLDFFSKVGAVRSNQDLALKLFKLAFAESPDIALRILLWAHDVRGGAGERQTFRTIMKDIIDDPTFMKAYKLKLLNKIPEIGRWDTFVYLLENTKDNDCATFMLRYITLELLKKNGLCAKWMPRQGYTAERIRGYLNGYYKMTFKDKALLFSRKDYRKMLVGLTNVVETKMSSKQWENIEYGKLPSVAGTRYKQAFMRHDSERYNNYIKDVVAGKEKMNMSVAFPHDVLRSLIHTQVDPASRLTANTMWDKLGTPDLGNLNCLCMCDVSGSMTGHQVSGSITAMDVAVATSIYISRNNTGKFRDQVLLFSSEPRLVNISHDDLYDAYMVLEKTVNCCSTNFSKAYMTLLNAAVRCKLPESEMPSMIFVLSDMEFDAPEIDDTNYDHMVKAYEAAGYKLPQLVFWNLNARNDGYSMQYDAKHAAMISGYSPAVLKSILSGQIPDPVSIMMDTVMDNRYDLSGKVNTRSLNELATKIKEGHVCVGSLDQYEGREEVVHHVDTYHVNNDVSNITISIRD